MIVVAGEALVDLVIDPVGGVVAALGGGPFNTARTLARLGSHVAFYGCISHDRFGSLLQQRLVGDGVDPVLTQRTELPTSLAAAELNEFGSATYRFYLENTSAPNLSSVELGADVVAVHAGTLGFVVDPMASVLESLILASGPNVLVMVDINCRPKVVPDRALYLERLRRVLARADVVKVSTEDLEYLGLASDLGDACAILITMGATAVLHTDGGEAVRVYTATEHVDVPVVSVVVADTIGAGDAFGGAFLAWWTQSGLTRSDLTNIELLARAAANGVVVAGDTCTRVGAEPPFVADLDCIWRPL